MSLVIYDTLRRAEVPFVPRVDGEVSIYSCGPTVQGDAHIGHGRFAVVSDVLRRYLTHQGYRVTFVQNVTDIDDKIILRARREKVPPAVISTRYTQAWNRTMDALGVQPPDIQPLATGHLLEMQALIEEQGGRVRSLQERNVELRTELERQRSRAAGYEEEQAGLSAQVAEQKATIEALQERNVLMRHELEQVQIKSERHEQRAEELQAALDEQHETAARLQELNDLLWAELEQYRADDNDLQELFERLRVREKRRQETDALRDEVIRFRPTGSS